MADALLEEANRRAHELARADLAVRDAQEARRDATPGTIAIYQAIQEQMDAVEHRMKRRRAYEEIERQAQEEATA